MDRNYLLEAPVKTHAVLKELDQLVYSLKKGYLTSTKRSILDAFVRLATLEGYSSASIRALATCVGLKPSSLYSHFPEGKEQIIAEALCLQIHSFTSALCEALRACSTPQDCWDGVVRLHVHELITCPENEMWDILIAKDRLGPFLGADVRRQVEKWTALVDNTYQAIAEDMGYDDCLQKARVIRQTLDATSRWWTWDGTEANLETAVQFANKVVTAIVAAR